MTAIVHSHSKELYRLLGAFLKYYGAYVEVVALCDTVYRSINV